MILKEYDLSVRLPQERAIDTGITLVQNDKDVYKLNVRIFDGVNEIDYSEVDSATITFLKRDNNVVQGNMAVEADQLSYTLGTNEIACPGKVLVSIQLFGTTERLSTARFVMSVERDLVTAEAVQSTSEFPILQQLKQDLEAIDVVDLTNQFNAHKAESASKHITESGSNSNGSYIKFDDGTMICFKENHELLYVYSNYVQSIWSFPATFNSPPAFSGTIKYSTVISKGLVQSINLNGVGVWSIENTRANAVRVYDRTSAFTSESIIDTIVMAIGRWKE